MGHQISNSCENSTNLIDRARRFRKDGRGRPAVENDEADTAQILLPKNQERRYFEWTAEMKVTLTTFDNEERGKGRVFMKRFKER